MPAAPPTLKPKRRDPVPLAEQGYTLARVWVEIFLALAIGGTAILVSAAIGLAWCWVHYGRWWQR